MSSRPLTVHLPKADWNFVTSLAETQNSSRSSVVAGMVKAAIDKEIKAVKVKGEKK